MKKPELTYKKRSIKADAIQLIYLFVFICIAIYFFTSISVPFRIAIGIILSFIFQWWIPGYILRNHHSGIRNAEDQNYEKAVIDFKKMYSFFQKYPWLDKNRHLLLGNVSDIPLQTICINNIVFCSQKLGDDATTEEYASHLSEKEIT